jgi:hypothetical protein
MISDRLNRKVIELRQSEKTKLRSMEEINDVLDHCARGAFTRRLSPIKGLQVNRTENISERRNQ